MKLKSRTCSTGHGTGVTVPRDLRAMLGDPLGVPPGVKTFDPRRLRRGGGRRARARLARERARGAKEAEARIERAGRRAQAQARLLIEQQRRNDLDSQARDTRAYGLGGFIRRITKRKARGDS